MIFIEFDEILYFFLHNLHDVVASVLFSSISQDLLCFCCFSNDLCCFLLFLHDLLCFFYFANKLKQIMVFGVTRTRGTFLLRFEV